MPNFHFLCLQLIDCIFCPLFWTRFQSGFQLMSNVLAVGLSKWKYYENTNQYLKNKHTYQPLSSASRGCLRKRPTTTLCNSNRDIFCGKTRSDVGFVKCVVYHIIQFSMLCACFCWQTALLNVDTTLCDYEKLNECASPKDILVINKPVVCTFQGLVIITNLD